MRRGAFAAVAALGVAGWVAVAALAPTPFGYVYDLYHEGVAWAFAHGGRVPPADACWVCVHPPLFFLVGVPFYAAGRWAWADPALAPRGLLVLSLAAAALIAASAHRLLRLYRLPWPERLAFVALALAFPCLAISAAGPEADVLLTALVSAFLVRLCGYHLRGRRAAWRDAAMLGTLCGLALLTKYSGALALVAAGAVVAVRLWRGPERRRWAVHLVLVAGLAAAIAGGTYLGNVRSHGTPLVANYSAKRGFALTARRFTDRYDFRSLSIARVLALYRPESGHRQLTTYPAYSEVWTSLHAQAWSDMSFFSVRGRYGDAPERQPYPGKRVPLALLGAVLVAGLYPTALAALGLAVTWRRRQLWPLLLFGAATAAVYLWWVVGQDEWAVKTKYVLFLLPPYLLYAALGLRAARRRLPRWAGRVALGAVFATAALAEAYVWAFALG